MESEEELDILMLAYGSEDMYRRLRIKESNQCEYIS
jgi:hypothetical protein